VVLGQITPCHFKKLVRAFVLVGWCAASSACASYAGTAKSADPHALARQGNWLMVPGFHRVMQESSDDCGGAALASVLRYWGRNVTPAAVEARVGRENRRLRAGDMVAYARSEGLRSYVFFGTMDDLRYELEQKRPVVVGLAKALDSKRALLHYEVVVGYEPSQRRLLLLDPDRGFQVDSVEGFTTEWMRSKGVTIVTFPPIAVTKMSER
jgi:ABC-type bacteriocin/lantibiotic exporter with double-glycine peptidase domain